MSDAVVIVLTTFPGGANAEALARRLVDEALAACVNILPPMRSIYRWEGAIEDATERQMIIKTTAMGAEALKARLIELHPYEIPEMLVIPISGGGEAYLKWIAESVGEGVPDLTDS